MLSIGLVLLVIALVLFILAAINVSSPVNLTAAGLACVVLAMLVGGATLG